MRIALAVVALVALSACSDAAEIGEHPCPPGGTKLTYDNFGKGFFLAYCIRCHGGTNGYSSHAFTTIEAIRAQKDRIFINAAGDNTSMPPGPDDPPEKYRDDLADWLACGAP